MDHEHYPRLLKTQINEALSDTPVICLLGPRQSGKTTLAKTIDSERQYINFDDTTLLKTAMEDPSGFVRGLPHKVVLDEVQRFPEILPAIKAEVDENRQPGRFILTGSANLLLLPKAQESLAGRLEVIYLNPLSEQEKHGAPDCLLSRLVEGRLKPVISGNQLAVEGIAEAVVSGGFPEPIKRPPKRARQWFRQYVDSIIQRDVKDIANIREEGEMRRLLEMLALRSGTLLNTSALANELSMQRLTIDRYLSVLERLFLTRKLPAWHRHDAKRLIKAPKIHLIDTGLISALRRLNVADWYKYSNDFGPVLESFVVQQLMCQAGWVDEDLSFYHYRDKDKVEVDLVIESGHKVWGVEVKKSTSVQSKDVQGLSRLARLAGNDWQGGILLYSGSNCLPLPGIENGLAVPMNQLWT